LKAISWLKLHDKEEDALIVSSRLENHGSSLKKISLLEKESFHLEKGNEIKKRFRWEKNVNWLFLT